MKKTITAAIAVTMLFVMGITSFAAPNLPDIIPDGGASLFDTILNFFDEILGLIGTIASMLFS